MTFSLHDGELSGRTLVFLAAALIIALGFEFVNGFHDTANAVATVIYTRSLRPGHAVLWSGLCNFLGVLLGGFGVAFSIVYLLPVDLLIAIGSGTGMAMVMALLVAAILWNLGTWYLAIPASSSHTLLGSILGVGVAGAFISGNSFASGVNWNKAREVGLSLFTAPMPWSVFPFLVLRLFGAGARRYSIAPPTTKRRHRGRFADPPSHLHGRQLRMAPTTVRKARLIMLILIGLLPNQFLLNLHYGHEKYNTPCTGRARASCAPAGVNGRSGPFAQNSLRCGQPMGCKTFREVSRGALAASHRYSQVSTTSLLSSSPLRPRYLSKTAGRPLLLRPRRHRLCAHLGRRRGPGPGHRHDRGGIASW